MKTMLDRRIALPQAKQILEALRYLRSIHFPFPHLHPRNVLVDPKGNALYAALALAFAMIHEHTASPIWKIQFLVFRHITISRYALSLSVRD
jgi:hypothetical protein